MKISIKKSNFGIHWNYLKLPKHKLSSLKMKNLHLNSESLSELENSETEFSLNNPLKRWKLIFSLCRRFQLTIFLNHATTLAGIFRKLVALLHNFFLILRACNGLMYSFLHFFQFGQTFWNVVLYLLLTGLIIYCWNRVKKLLMW